MCMGGGEHEGNMHVDRACLEKQSAAPASLPPTSSLTSPKLPQQQLYPVSINIYEDKLDLVHLFLEQYCLARSNEFISGNEST